MGNENGKCPKCNADLHLTESIITFTKRLECPKCKYSKVIKKGKIKGNRNIELLRGFNGVVIEQLSKEIGGKK